MRLGDKYMVSVVIKNILFITLDCACSRKIITQKDIRVLVNKNLVGSPL